jgi:hypothetical protein
VRVVLDRVRYRGLQGLTAEFGAEAAGDIDGLKTVIEEAEYQVLGHGCAADQEGAIGSLRTETARQLAEALSASDPQWRSGFAAAPCQGLHASARRRRRGLRG